MGFNVVCGDLPLVNRHFTKENKQFVFFFSAVMSLKVRVESNIHDMNQTL